MGASANLQATIQRWDSERNEGDSIPVKNGPEQSHEVGNQPGPSKPPQAELVVPQQTEKS